MTLAIKTQFKKRFSPKLNLEQAFRDLLDVVLVKGSLYVKARDLTIVLGIGDHYRVTQLGVLLSLLAKHGLARKWNHRRPVRYTLAPRALWERFLEECSKPNQRFQCKQGVPCRLFEVCPFTIMKEMLEEVSMHD